MRAPRTGARAACSARQLNELHVSCVIAVVCAKLFSVANAVAVMQFLDVLMHVST
ncbi:hypothetical protein PR001_g33308 [Phytophthora rubi]|uniref:Uncharacterized protein n=1 Tax=Phytophthora rubi TaxID=129364 RepID=A0A6A3G6S1_9STRA|nr:hypothetical protein PR001_g33308 [Phytophthora rubi]